ncbi:MAG: biopolymer transporter ExbD [Myxococcales bacterium]|nr:biopolymer transporter ExbD [Myxococcales bacterium]
MSDEIEEGGGEFMTDEEIILAERARAKSRKKREAEPEIPLNINSMMDMMTIILCFLLKSVGAEPVQINQNDDLRLPFSTSELAPEDMLILSITKKWVMVGDEQVTPITEGRIDPTELQSAESAIIPALQQRIEEQMREQEEFARRVQRDYERVVTIVADEKTPYRILTQVMITASQAGMQNFKFAIMQREQGSGARSGL